MQQSTQLAALLVALCSDHTLAGGGGGSNSTIGANYTALAAQLGALRLANSSNSSANSSGQGHLGARHSSFSGQQFGRLGQRGHSKKTAHVVHGKKGPPSKKTTRKTALQPPSHQRHNSSAQLCPQAAHSGSSAGGHSRNVGQSPLAQASSNRTFSHDSRDNSTNSRPQVLYRQNHQGYVLETRRQRKRRMAREGDATPLSTANFTTVSSDCRGHYRLAENIDLNRTNATLPLCTHFQGLLKGDGHTLRINGEKPLFEQMKGAAADVKLQGCTLKATDPSATGLLAKRLYGNSVVRIEGGLIAMHNGGTNPFVGIFGEITDGTHTLEQNDVHALLSGTDIGGAAGAIYGSDVTLSQTDCTFAVSNLKGGGGGSCLARPNGYNPLILTQTNVTVTETELAKQARLFGGGIGQIDGRDIKQTGNQGVIVLTQTAVDISLYKAENTPGTRYFEGATFGLLGGKATVVLRLFSGTSTVNTCGIAREHATIRGVIDTAAYAAADINATSCTTGDHNSAQLQLLDTTQPQQWRQAHQEFCCSREERIPAISCFPDHPASCHYPHEQLLITVAVGDGSALLLTRQSYPYNSTSAEHGLLRISRLLLNNLNFGSNSAETDRSFGADGILLFAPGAHHQQLQPGHVMLAQVNDRQENLTLLCRTNDSNGTVYHLGTLSLNNSPDNINVTMQSLAGLKGEPVMLTSAREPQAAQISAQIWTYEKNGKGGGTFYLYEAANVTAPVQRYNLTQTENDTVIAMSADDHALYVARRNLRDVVFERIDRQNREIEELPARLNVTAEMADSSADAGLPYSLQLIGNKSLLLIPRHTILAQDHNCQLQALQVSLPPYGGTPTWRQQDTLAAGIRGQNDTNDDHFTFQCRAPEQPQPAATPHSRAPFEAPLIGSVVAACSLCCVNTAAALIYKRCRHSNSNRFDKTATVPALTATANDNEAANKLQEKSDTSAWQ